MVTSIVTAPVGSSTTLEIVVIAVLILLLFAREFTAVRARSASPRSRLHFLIRALDAPILSLLVVFIVILAIRITGVL